MKKTKVLWRKQQFLFPVFLHEPDLIRASATGIYPVVDVKPTILSVCFLDEDTHPAKYIPKGKRPSSSDSRRKAYPLGTPRRWSNSRNGSFAVFKNFIDGYGQERAVPETL
jgi:hypothetical protein